MIQNKIKIMKTFKQKKYSNLINNYFNKLFLLESKTKYKNILITVLYVYINKILNYSKIYISIYPNIYNNIIKNKLNLNKKYYKKKLSFIFKNKFKIPNIYFLLSNQKILNFINFYKFNLN
ncbi:MAG: hypothetical protein NHG14_00290 [Candidatus Shikimatogenerans bostrichidophilus]|nr:MAG: hypothetical protein NHG14_00290 [Candidatus Shikimatogenerans bostrichidophilus]